MLNPIPDWTTKAACAGQPVNLFYPDDYEVGVTDADYTEPLALCARCPVVAECKAYADEVEGDDPRIFGVWGGETPFERLLRRWENGTVYADARTGSESDTDDGRADPEHS